MPFIQLQFRRGTATQWTSANPVLADGELAIESDTSKFKIGNGNASWTLLPYGGLVGPTGTIGNTVSIDVSFNGNIFVGRDVSFGGKLAVRNDVSFNTELRVGGNINIRSSAASISRGTGALIVAGGVGVGGNVWTGGNLVIGGDASFNNRLFVENDVSFGAKLCVQSDVSFNGNTSVALLPFYTGNATITPATNQLVTKKYVDENGGTILLGANNVWTGNNNFNGNTSVAILPVYTGNASVTPATNQLVTKKYVDENGGTILLSGNNIWTANNTFNGSRFYVNADASFNSKLTVSGDASLNSNLFVGRNMIVGGDVSFNDNMSVQSDSSFNNRLYVGRQIGVGVTANSVYALDVLGNINLTGNLYLNNKLFSITSADISLNANLMVGADASFNGNVFIARTLNLRKTVLTGAAIGSPTSIAAATPIVEITGAGASTAYFNLANGSYAGQTLTIISATNGGGGGLFVNAVASNIIFNGSVCSQMRFSNAFQTVNLIWSADVNDWIVASWQGVNFGGVSMNFGTYTSGDITLGAAGRVNINPGVGGMVVGSDSSLNGNLSVGGTDSSFNGNLYTGGYINAEGFIERFVNVASSSGTYTADFNNGIIIYVNAFSGSSTPTLSITNLPTVLNQSYVFTVVYSGPATSTYFSALNINGVSVPVSGSVSLTAASSYYVHQFCIFFTDATNLGNNFVVQNFNSSAPLSLVSPLVSGNLSVNGNINLTGGNIFQNGTLFTGGGGGVGTSGNSLSLSGNLTVAGNAIINGMTIWNGGNPESAALGVNALGNGIASGGYTNTAIGYNTLRSQPYKNNTAVGGFALMAHTGVNSTAVGASALQLNTTGNTNTALGFQSLFTNTTGNDNTAVGAYALYNLVGQTRNVAVGFAAGNGNNPSYVGNYNTFIGSNTFQDGTGSYNTYLGHQAFSAVGTFGNSTAIGVGAQITGNNQIVLGRSTEFVSILGTASSTSNTTGALRVAGGVGINGNLNVAGPFVYINDLLLQGFNGAASYIRSINGYLYLGYGATNNVLINSGGLIVDGKITSRTFVSNYLEGNLFVGLDLTNNTGNFNAGRSVCINFNNSISVMNRITSVDIGTSTFQTGFEFYTKQDTNFYKSMQIYATVAGGETASNNCDVKIFGSLNVTGSINGITVGRWNGNYTNNTAIGLNALASITTGLSSPLADFNTAVGTNALNLNANGYSNSAFGASALHNNTTGFRNVAIGLRSHETNTTGINNVAIGYEAGRNGSFTTTSYNTFLGSDTNITGNFTNSTAIGVGAQITGNNQIKLGRENNTEYVYCGSALRLNPTDSKCDIRNLNIGQNLNFGIGTTDYLTVNASGIAVTGIVAATSFNATSDYRIKQNVHFIIEDASFNVDVLKPVSYLNTQLGKPDIGFIAHEVQEHYPYLVNGEKDGESMQTLNYTGIIGILVKEIQELKKRVRDLELRTP